MDTTVVVSCVVPRGAFNGYDPKVVLSKIANEFTVIPVDNKMFVTLVDPTAARGTEDMVQVAKKTVERVEAQITTAWNLRQKHQEAGDIDKAATHTAKLRGLEENLRAMERQVTEVRRSDVYLQTELAQRIFTDYVPDGRSIAIETETHDSWADVGDTSVGRDWGKVEHW